MLVCEGVYRTVMAYCCLYRSAEALELCASHEITAQLPNDRSRLCITQENMCKKVHFYMIEQQSAEGNPWATRPEDKSPMITRLEPQINDYSESPT